MCNFGDRVRIKETPETAAAGVAGAEGDVYGFTTPSVTSVDVIGGAPDDYAINVNLDALGTHRWFRPDLIEFLHYNVGVEMTVGNARAVRQADGSWAESPINAPASNQSVGRKEPLLRSFFADLGNERARALAAQHHDTADKRRVSVSAMRPAPFAPLPPIV